MTEMFFILKYALPGALNNAIAKSRKKIRKNMKFARF